MEIWYMDKDMVLAPNDWGKELSSDKSLAGPVV
jgi:hypothetical protein